MIRFYYGSGSPYSWRVQLLLEEKGLAYEPVLLSFSKGEHKSAEHLARSPHGKVPALTDGDVTLYESSAILEYLEERYPKPAFLPADPATRARIRIEEIEGAEYCFAAFRPVARQLFFTKPNDRDAAALAAGQAATRAEIERLEARAARPGATWIVGDALSHADLTWLPFLEIAARGGVDLDPTRTPWLAAWRDRMRKRPSYERSYPPHWRG
jgi:glutathione S-transferase